MEKTRNRVIYVIKALLCSYVVTGIMLLILTLLLYKLELKEEIVKIGILATYVLSSFVGGTIIGRTAGTRKFLWGLILGVLYFGLLVLVAAGVNRGVEGNWTNLATTFLLCAGGGMIGGMIVR